MHISLVFVWSIINVALSVPGGDQVEKIVSAHESSIGLIHTADIHLEVRRRSSNELIETLRWSMDGPRERIRSKNETVPVGELNRFSDCYMDTGQVYMLGDADPQGTPAIRPFRSQGMYGWIKPRTRRLINMRASYWLLLKISLVAEDERRTLAELVHDSQSAFGDAGVIFKGSHEVSGIDTVWLRIQHPGVMNEDTGKTSHRGSIIDIFLDPQRGYLAKRVESHLQGTYENGKTGPYESNLEVQSFDDLGDGVYFPTAIVSEFLDMNKKRLSKVEYKYLVSQASVNKPLPDDAMNFKFPENLLVRQLPFANGRYPLHLIGANGQIVRTVSTSEEVQDLMETVENEESTQAGLRNRIYVVCGLLLPIIALTTVFIIRRQMRRSSEK